MACGVNPQGYHSINFGGFVPKSSFRVKQQLATARQGTATGPDDTTKCLRVSKSFTLPEIKVKKLFDKTKKRNHSRSHTCDGVTSEKRRLPSIPLRAAGSVVAHAERDQSGHTNNYSREKRVVKNGDPWWKWPKRNDVDEQSGRKDNDSSAVMLTEQKSVSRRLNHNLRQKLPPLVGYRDDNGKVYYSETRDNNFINDNNMMGTTNHHRKESDICVNRRYYYSKSRDGIRPRVPVAKLTMKHAYLFDLGSASCNQLTEKEFSAEREAILNSMHRRLQDIPGLSASNGFMGAHLNTLNSRTAARLKQSLIRWHSEKNMDEQPVTDGSTKAEHQEHTSSLPKLKNVHPTTVNIDGLGVTESTQANATTAPGSKYVNSKNLKELAILSELIEILNSAHYVEGSQKYVHASGVSQPAVANKSTVTQVNMGEFFQKPESEIKRYDRFKSMFSEMSRAQQHGGNLDTITEEPEPQERESNGGLNQLLAIQPLQKASIYNTSISCHAKSSINKSTSRAPAYKVDLSDVSVPRRVSKINSTADSCKPQCQLMCVDLNNQYLEFFKFHSTAKDPKANTEKSELDIDCSLLQQNLNTAGNFDVQQQPMMCVNLNEQFNEFSQGRLRRRKTRLSPKNRKKLEHHLFKQLQEVEGPAEKVFNPRADLEVCGASMKHLYDLGLFDKDQDLGNIAQEG